MSDGPPHDLDAERALLGSVLLVPLIIGDARWVISADEFYRPQHQRWWEAMLHLYEHGKPIDEITVAAELDLDETTRLELRRCLDLLPASSRWPHYAERVLSTSVARRLIVAASSAATDTVAGEDPWTVANRLERELLRLAAPPGVVPPDMVRAGVVADLADADLPAELVPGWLRRGDRAVVVAAEGLGKSVLTAQWAAQVAAGINPMWPSHRFPPSTTLLIDLENPTYLLKKRIAGLRRAAGPDWHDLMFVWTRPEGIDVRDRSTLRELDAILQELRPSLVVLSPLYKAFRRAGREDHEDVAAAVQPVLDDLRARYGFALVIEHHAPKASAGKREIVPFGSSLWLRWPEYGVTLSKGKDETELKVGRFRNDRVENHGWPTHLLWGREWPWEASFRDPDRPSPWRGSDPSY